VRLGAVLGIVILASAGLAHAQPPALPAPPNGPSLHITGTSAAQLGADLRFVLRFDRALPAGELRGNLGRSVCVVLSPQAATRRRACVGQGGNGGLLAATLARVDAGGAALERPRALRDARIAVDGDILTLRVPAAAVHVTLGRALSWQGFLRWRDGTGCDLLADRRACIQLVPATGASRLATRVVRRATTARRPQALHLLATGDSMIQTIDGDLARALASHGGSTVRSDARPGTGISKPADVDWVRRARSQAADLKPDVTVVFLGANDGFAMKGRGGTAACCGPAWVAAYASRVAAMMRSYLRGGRSYVYWLTLPAPRPASFARVFPRVNEAIRRAAKRVGGGVRVIDLVPVFTPGGTFRQTITFRGRTIDARQPDGVHLSPAGASVAAALVVDQLRADHALPIGSAATPSTQTP
jgi:lysophospholipase L1-like esterase